MIWIEYYDMSFVITCHIYIIINAPSLSLSLSSLTNQDISAFWTEGGSYGVGKNIHSSGQGRSSCAPKKDFFMGRIGAKAFYFHSLHEEGRGWHLRNAVFFFFLGQRWGNLLDLFSIFPTGAPDLTSLFFSPLPAAAAAAAAAVTSLSSRKRTRERNMVRERERESE